MCADGGIRIVVHYTDACSLFYMPPLLRKTMTAGVGGGGNKSSGEETVIAWRLPESAVPVCYGDGWRTTVGGRDGNTCTATYADKADDSVKGTCRLWATDGRRDAGRRMTRRA